MTFTLAPTAAAQQLAHGLVRAGACRRDEPLPRPPREDHGKLWWSFVSNRASGSTGAAAQGRAAPRARECLGGLWGTLSFELAVF
eukprot:SAG11_NODE_2196_length_3699_cov_2.962222_4_plen_85_part_00